MRRYTAMLAASICLLILGEANATPGYRPATPAEEAYLVNVYATLEKAIMKAGQEGWREIYKTPLIPETTNQVPVNEDGPYKGDFEVIWQNDAKTELADAEREKGIKAGAVDLGSPKNLALQARFQDLLAKGAAAAGRGDTRGAEKIQVEIDAVTKEMDKENEKIDRVVNGTPLEASKDTTAQIAIWFNNEETGFNKNTRQVKPVAGLSAYRLHDGAVSAGGNWEEGSTCAGLGGWKLHAADGMKGLKTTLDRKMKKAAVQTLLVCAAAEETRAAALLEAVDWDLLKKLVAK